MEGRTPWPRAEVGEQQIPIAECGDLVPERLKRVAKGTPFEPAIDDPRRHYLPPKVPAPPDVPHAA